MKKQRMTSLDIRAITTLCKHNIVGSSVVNIYDISNKTYIIKCSKKELKYFLLVEAERRMHVTEWKREKNTMPSSFTMKLRKHLRSRKLTNISQLGGDRVVDIQFGFEENAFHLIVEFYVSGNIVLTDHTYKIINVLRNKEHSGVSYSVNEIYNLEIHTSVFLYKDLITSTRENIKKCIEEILECNKKNEQTKDIVQVANTNKGSVKNSETTDLSVLPVISENKKNEKRIDTIGNENKVMKKNEKKEESGVNEKKNNIIKNSKSEKYIETITDGIKSEGKMKMKSKKSVNQIIEKEENEKKKTEKLVITFNDLASKLFPVAHKELINHLLESLKLNPIDLIKKYDINTLTEKMYKVINYGLDIWNILSNENTVIKGYSFILKNSGNDGKKKKNKK